MDNPFSYTAISKSKAVARLARGELVILPTETVYGLAADATNADAVLKIFATKKRPRFNPLICHCANLEMAAEIGVFGEAARVLAATFWPGPLTLVLERANGKTIPDLVTAGLNTIALRVPAHDLTTQIISDLGRPVAAPSANFSGALSATSAKTAFVALGANIPVVDGGACDRGLESTIIALSETNPILLRPGALARDEIEAVLGDKLATPGPDGPITAPGMLASHYAPRASLRLNAGAPEPGESWLGFGPEPGRPGAALNLSPTGDMAEAARNLFEYLRHLDEKSPATIAVASIPETAIGEAINDRLRRAAAPRNLG
ncbi:MAG: threonylcarbamoyl-AMP synthase [Alphaproteobacteria bacterium]|nr:threonylcarbamoyl-AMP synthase [Alphaproteobacteria bacterium]